MSFYQQLSEYYDEIFSFNEAEAAFLKTRLERMQSMLDIGCATGGKTVLFAGQMERVVGIDADESMIAMAREHHFAPNVTYLPMDMRALAENFQPKSFDAVLCLGNTLAHLDSHEAMARLIKDMASVARERIIIQIVNYDRIIDQHISELPTVQTRHVVFTRQYKWDNRQLHFMTAIINRENNQTFSNDIILTPLRKHELALMLNHAGFATQRYYDDFNGGPWRADSFATIVVAEQAKDTT